MTKPIVYSVAMSLYIFNVSPTVRAQKLYNHFEGACAEPEELLDWVDRAYWATRMPMLTARAYLLHALERYGDEAQRRVEAETLGFPDIPPEDNAPPPVIQEETQ